MRKKIIYPTIVLFLLFIISFIAVAQVKLTDIPIECWKANTQSGCTSLGAVCKWNPSGFCDRTDCFSADNTNQSYCETTLNT